MLNMLDIQKVPASDESITNIQYHAYNPYTISFNNSDEIRIAIQQQDLYVLPHESMIYIEGTTQLNVSENIADNTEVKLINNAAAFLFDEIRYELNNFEIDRCKNVGVTTTMKGYVSYGSADMKLLKIAGWNMNEENVANADGKFNFCIPLKTIFGFAEDYKHILMNVKHELIITRSRSDTNMFIGGNDRGKFVINKIQWRMPHIQVSDVEKLKLLKYIDRKQPIPLNFRSWEIYEYPTLPVTDKHVWAVKASTQIQTPRYIIIGFQTKRNNVINKDMSHFDHCNLTDLKVYLNSECYPYENLNINFNENQYAILYYMYSKFQESYYQNSKAICEPLLSFSEFKSRAPLIVIDCSRQNEIIKHGVIDIRINMQLKHNMQAETAAYCIIIHENIITYNPYTNIVNRLS